ncbi:MAG: hypothetical protein ACTSXK_00695, partial [Promethearchaeota archaeon]
IKSDSYYNTNFNLDGLIDKIVDEEKSKVEPKSGPDEEHDEEKKTTEQKDKYTYMEKNIQSEEFCANEDMVANANSEPIIEKLSSTNLTDELLKLKNQISPKETSDKGGLDKQVGFGFKKLLKIMSSEKENEKYMPNFTINKLRNMFKTGTKLPVSISEKKLSKVIKNIFSKPFNDHIGDIKTKSLRNTVEIFQILLKDKFHSQRFINVKFSDKLRKIVSNTHELYQKLGLEDEIPTDMQTNNIESKRLIDPKFLLFFLETGITSDSSEPSLSIETNLDWINLGYKDSELDPIINYETQSEMIIDYYISIIHSFVIFQKLTGSQKKPLQILRTWGKIRISNWGEKYNLKQKVDVLIKAILNIGQILGTKVEDFLFEKIIHFPLLQKKGMNKELIMWLKKNWRNIPYIESYQEIQFFHKWLEIEPNYQNNLINNPKTKFEVTRFAQSIIEMGNILHIDRFFPHNPINEPIGTDANVLNDIILKMLLDLVPISFNSFFKQISLFTTQDLHDIKHRFETNPISIPIFKLFILEYLKQLATNLIFQGDTSEFTEFNKNLWNAQKLGLIESPIFSKNYLVKYDFSGNYWLDEYFTKSPSKIHLYRKSKSLMTFSFSSIDENGKKRSFTAKGHPAESHLFRITTKYRDQAGNLVPTLQNMLYDTWYYTTLNYQNEADMRFVRDAPDILISHKNYRKDLQKDVYMDGIYFYGFLFGNDALLPEPQERAGIKTFEYFISKFFDSLGIRVKYHPLSDTLVPNKKIALNQIKKFEPGVLTPYKDSRGKNIKLELHKLLPPKHFEDDGYSINGYYNTGIPFGTSYRDLYRDVMMSGNAHIFKRLQPSILKRLSSKKITPIDGNFGIIFDYEVAQFYYQARLIAGKRYAAGIITQFKNKLDFILSLKNLNFDGTYEEKLGLPSKIMAKKIFIAFGLNWNCINPKDPKQLYLWPQAKKMWDDLDIQNSYIYGNHNNLWAKVAFYGIYRHISETSKQIHLLFNPNEFFSSSNNMWQNKLGIFDKNIMEKKLTQFFKKKLVRWEIFNGKKRMFWNYPGNPSIHLKNYRYFSIAFLNDFLNKNS